MPVFPGRSGGAPWHQTPGTERTARLCELEQLASQNSGSALVARTRGTPAETQLVGASAHSHVALTPAILTATSPVLNSALDPSYRACGALSGDFTMCKSPTYSFPGSR